jgi:hypothetical protein
VNLAIYYNLAHWRTYERFTSDLGGALEDRKFFAMRRGTCRRWLAPGAPSLPHVDRQRFWWSERSPDVRHDITLPRDPFRRRIDRNGGHGGTANAADFTVSVASIGASGPVARVTGARLLLERASAELLAVVGNRGCAHRWSNGDATLAHPRRLPADLSFSPDNPPCQQIWHRNRLSSGAVNALPSVLSNPFVGVAVSPWGMPLERHRSRIHFTPKNRLMS